MSKARIKVGVVLGSARVPAWQYHLLERLKNSDSATLCVVAVHDRMGERGNRPRPYLYRLFERRHRFGRGNAHDACVVKDVRELAHNVEWIRIYEQASSAGGEDHPALKQVRPYDLDVILVLGSLELMDVLGPAAKSGLWYFQHDYGPTSDTDCHLVGFWEVVRRRSHIKAALVVRRLGEAEDAVAYESYSGINWTSHVESRNKHLWKTLFFVPRVLERLHRLGPEKFRHELDNATRPDVPIDLPGRRMTNFRLVVPLLLYGLWRVRMALAKRFYLDRWTLMFSWSPAKVDLTKFKSLTPPQGRFWADPYPLRRNNDLQVFFEDACLNTGRGHIAALRISRNGECTTPIPVLQRHYHLSYPFLFEWKGELFMVPETAENSTIELYRCAAFPYQWEFCHNLMQDVLAYDTTLLEFGGFWWMFTSVKAHPEAPASEELCLYYADSPIATHWHAHPMNPVLSDARYARPAGRIFVENAELYRPSQDSSRRYGYAVNINRILELTTTNYREVVVNRLEPGWNKSVVALHTFNQADQLTVIDAVYRSAKWQQRWQFSSKPPIPSGLDPGSDSLRRRPV